MIAPESDTRHFEFSHIIVIESLEDDDVKTGLNLYNDILSRLSYREGNFQSRYVPVSNLDDLLKELEGLRVEAREDGLCPFLHFEIHGDENLRGLILKSGELITWTQIAEQFRSLNVILKNNLFVSLATCYGAHFFQAVKSTEAAPVVGFNGPWIEVYEDDVEASFSEFFLEFDRTLNLDLAVTALNNSNQNLSYRYHFYPSEEIFNKSWNMYVSTSYTPEGKEERILDLIRRAKENPSETRSEQELRELIEFRLNPNEERERLMRTFMMLD